MAAEGGGDADVGYRYIDEAAAALQGPEIWAWALLPPIIATLLFVPLAVVLAWFWQRPLARARERDPELAWYDEARLGFSLRKRLASIGLVFPILAGLAGDLIGWPAPVWVPLLAKLLGFSLVWSGVVLVAHRSEHWVTGRAMSLRVFIRDYAITVLLFAPHTWLLVAAMLILPLHWGGLTMVLLGVAAFLWWLLVHRGLSVWMLRKAGLLSAPSARLDEISKRAQADTGIEAREVCRLRWTAANAVAISRIDAIGMSDGALEVLDDAEVHAVMCHELGHIADMPQMRRHHMLSAWLLFPLTAAKPFISSFGFMPFVAIYFALALVLKRLQKAQRGFEARADEEAAAGADPATYARALEKIHRHSLVPVVLAKKPSGSHPDLYDRMVEIGHPPDYPRPLPPSEGNVLVTALTFLAFVVALAGVLLFGRKHLGELAQDGKVWVLPALEDETRLGFDVVRAELRKRVADGDIDAAAALARYVAMWDPHRGWRDFEQAARHSLAAAQRGDAVRCVGWAGDEYYHEISKDGEPPEIVTLEEELGLR